MATIQSAIQSGVLVEYRLPEWEVRPPLRPLYVAPEFFDWADAKPELVDWNRKIGGRVLFDHLEQMFCDLRCSRRPGAGDLRRVMPTGLGIWKAHPPGLRIYGWFWAPLHYVVVAGALEEETKKDKKLNGLRRDEVLGFIAEHGLEETVRKGDQREVLQESR